MGYKTPAKLCFSVGSSGFNPIDATTYNFSSYHASTPSTTIIGHQMVVPQNGTICCVDVTGFAGTVTGTNEALSLYVRVNDTTNYLVETVSAATVNRFWRNTNLNIPITTTDTFCLQLICPTWVTNPESLRFMGILVVNIE